MESERPSTSTQQGHEEGEAEEEAEEEVVVVRSLVGEEETEEEEGESSLCEGLRRAVLLLETWSLRPPAYTPLG